MIRPAETRDVQEIARLGEEFHAAAGWSDVFGYSVEDCALSLTEYLAHPGFICLVADTGGITGMAAGFVAPVYFNRSHVSGEELFWWVSPDAPQMAGIRLLEALEGAARSLGAQSWQMKAIDRLDGARMAKLYERRGYRASEYSYIKRL